MPDDPCFYTNALEELKVFNLFGLTDTDMKRGKMYVEQSKREKMKTEVGDLKEFIRKLDIKVEMQDANSTNMSRIAQLTQKTNQFNVTTRRYQVEDIKKFADSKDYIVKCMDVNDRFGEYGITGAIIIKKETNFWEIDTLLLSCRILGKDIEFAFLQQIIDLAAQEGIKEMKAKFVATKKNMPAKSFFSDVGFELVKDSNEQDYLLTVGKEKRRELFATIK